MPLHCPVVTGVVNELRLMQFIIDRISNFLNLISEIGNARAEISVMHPKIVGLAMFRSIVRQHAVTKDALYSLGMGKMVRSVI